MKNLLFLFLLFFCFIAKGQKMFSVKYESRADVKVFVVDYESRADLLVYKVRYQSMVDKNEGKWFFVDYESRAGWRENSEMHLLY